MVKIDLITGFLGSGKTTFIRKYAQYLMEQGMNIGILENDYGAVNVDMMLLQDLMGDNCELEMVAGGCDKDCHRRRFKTKLIAMGMCGYDRVLVEPTFCFSRVSKKTLEISFSQSVFADRQYSILSFSSFQLSKCTI